MGKLFQYSLFILLLLSNGVGASGFKVDVFKEIDTDSFSSQNIGSRFGLVEEDPMACRKKYLSYRGFISTMTIEMLTVLHENKPVAYFFTCSRAGPKVVDTYKDEETSLPGEFVITEIGIVNGCQKKEILKFLGQWAKENSNGAKVSFLGRCLGSSLIVPILDETMELSQSSETQAKQIAKLVGMSHVASRKGEIFFELSAGQKEKVNISNHPLFLSESLVLLAGLKSNL